MLRKEPSDVKVRDPGALLIESHIFGHMAKNIKSPAIFWLGQINLLLLAAIKITKSMYVMVSVLLFFVKG